MYVCILFDAEGVHHNLEKVVAIRAIQEPQDTQKLQTFLGIATYMAPFIPNLSDMSEPLRNLLKRDTDFQWSPSHKTAFENIKQSIRCEDGYPGRRIPSRSSVQAGKVIAFASRALTGTRKVTRILSVSCLLLLWLARNFTPIYI